MWRCLLIHFIYSFFLYSNEYLLNVRYVPATDLDSGESVVNKTYKSLLSGDGLIINKRISKIQLNSLMEDDEDNSEK